MSAVDIRAAEPDDVAAITAVETAADALLIEALGAATWPPAGPAIERLAASGFLLVATAEDEIVGFVHVLEVDGHAHLEQLSVLPHHGRQGIGRRLMSAVLVEARARGYSRLTLRTYAEIPWNAPFYASCGFLESIPETPFQRELVITEARLGLDRFGRRVQMTAEL